MNGLDISKMRLSMAPLTETVYAGFPDKNGNQFVRKVDVQKDFLQCIIDWCGPGYKRKIVRSDDKVYEVSMVELK